MQTQTDGPIKANAVLELIRALPGARLEVPRSGYTHDRAIAVFLGAKHLDKLEEDLVVDKDKGLDERAELTSYVDVIHGLVEDQRLFVSERVISLGNAGVIEEEFFETLTVYTMVASGAIPLIEVELPGEIRSAEDLYRILKWRGAVTYRTRFEPGTLGHLCEIAKSFGDDPSRNDDYLGYVEELRAAKRLEETVVPFADTQQGSKEKVMKNLPAAHHTLRAL